MSRYETHVLAAGPRRETAVTKPSPIKVAIIEDHSIVRAGLRMLIENGSRMTVLWETTTATAALSNPALAIPDIILLDLDLGVELGHEYVSSLLRRFSPSRILVLTAIHDTQQQRAAVSAGASGVVIKEEAPEDLLKAIESINAGRAWLPTSLMATDAGKLFQRGSDMPDPEAEKIARLTPRESEIVVLVSQGFNGERIARELAISEATVRNHLTSILAKLGLANKFELAVYAHRHKLGGKLS